MSFTSRERRQLHAEGWRRAGPREREDGHELIRISVRRGKLECDGCSRTFKYARGLGNHRKHGQAQLAQQRPDDDDSEMHHADGIDGDGDGDGNGDDGDSNGHGDGDGDGEAGPDAEEEHIADIPDQVPPSTDLQCPGCMSVFGHKGALSTHQRHCKVLNHARCDECDVSFDSKAALDGHNSQVHSDRRRDAAIAVAAVAAAPVPRVVQQPPTTRFSELTPEDREAMQHKNAKRDKEDAADEAAVAAAEAADELEHDIGLRPWQSEFASMDDDLGLGATIVQEAWSDDRGEGIWSAILEKLQAAQLGRGIDTDLSDKQKGKYRRTVGMLIAAGEASGLHTEEELLAGVIARRSRTRALLLHSLTKKSQEGKAYDVAEHLQRLRTVLAVSASTAYA